MIAVPTPERPIVDWRAIEALSWVTPMMGSTQDPIHHAEGDVWTHVRMVTEALLADPRWAALPEARREALFWAALLHDVAKPRTRVEENGRVSNPGHSRLGAMDARGVLWRMGVERNIREAACAIVAVHQSPFWLLERDEWQARWLLLTTALSVEPQDVAIHAAADARGRECPDKARMLDNVALYEMMSEDWDTARPGTHLFASDHARVRYFAEPETRLPSDIPFDVTDRSFIVTLTSGIPGSGKSTVAAALARNEDLPVLSLDGLRDEMGIDATDNQGQLIQTAQERAREFLRAKRSFLWDGTNLTRDMRRRVTSLAHNYGARTRIVSVERPYEETMAANRARRDPVPEAVVNRMVAKWEPPTLAECYETSVTCAPKPRSGLSSKK